MSTINTQYVVDVVESAVDSIQDALWHQENASATRVCCEDVWNKYGWQIHLLLTENVGDRLD